MSSSVGSASCQVRLASPRNGAIAVEQRAALGAADMQAWCRRRQRLTPGHGAAELARRSAPSPSATKACRPELRDDLARRAARHQLAVGDVGDLVTALGLVHVVGRDQHR